MSKSSKVSGRFSRRSILKGAACVAGVATGTRGITGFPAVHAQEPKVLRYLGTAVNQSLDIARKVKEDTGITIEYIPLSTDDVTRRIITQPNSFDIVDEEYFSLKKVIPSGSLLGMDARRIKHADRITPIFTKGELPSGKKIGDQGTAPKKVFYLEGQNGRTFAASPTEWITLIPTVYNADTLGIRPDLIKRPIESWKELLNPQFKGKASILNIPSIGIMDAAMVVEAMGEHKYGDKGNQTKAELDLTMKVMTEAKNVGRSGHSVDVVAGGHGRPLEGDRLHLSTSQGGISRLGGRVRRATHPVGPQGRSRLRIHQLVSRWLGRGLSQSSGLLLCGSSDREGQDGAIRVGVLDGRQAGREGHQGAGRHPLGEGRHRARRRILRNAHGRGGVLELRDGRKRLPD